MILSHPLSLGFLTIDENTLYDVSNYLEPREDKEPGPRPPILDKIAEMEAQASAPAASSVPTNASSASAAINTPSSSSSAVAGGEMKFEMVPGSPFSFPDANAGLMFDPKTKEIIAMSIPRIIERVTHHAIPGTSSPSCSSGELFYPSRLF